MGFVKKNNKWGAFDLKGRQKIEHLYEDIYFLRNVIRVKLNGKWGAIDANGTQIVSFTYESSDFNENEAKKQN